MKTGKEVVLNQTQQSKNSRGLKAAPSNILWDVKLKKGNLKQYMASFGSPVVKKQLTGATKEMKDKLGRRLIKDTSAERAWANRKGVTYPKTEYSKSEQSGSYEVDKFLNLDLDLFTETKYEYDDYKAKYLGAGVSGNVYSLCIDCNSPSYVIKEAKKKKHSNPIGMSQRGIKSEFEILSECQKEKGFQRGIAIMQSRDGNYFLISEFEEGKAAGLKHLSITEHEFKNIGLEDRNQYQSYTIYYNPYSYRNELKPTMDLIKSLDGRNVFNSDLNIEDNLQKGRTEARTFLKEYLRHRSEYCDTSNRFERLKKDICKCNRFINIDDVCQMTQKQSGIKL